MRRNLLTRKQLAAALNCNPRTLSKWQDDGMPVAAVGRGGRPSQYDEAACRAWLEARQPETDAPVDVARERARKEHAQALLVEQMYAIRARTLLPVEEVELAWSAEQAAVRAKLLALPQAYADRVARAVTKHGLAGAEAVIRAMVDEALNELAALARPAKAKRKAASAA
jgi:phage terminase Nu1 subunit (DNA packaging protein)